jgi:hypothetical protein
MVQLTLSLDGGGTAQLLETDGEVATMHSTRATPPGMPLSGTSADGQKYQLKIRGCRRDGDTDDGAPRYRIDGRWVSLSRAQRLALVTES